jgi:hypothetical protein
MIIPIPVGEKHGCTVQATTAKAVVCEECGKTYVYVARRFGEGTGNNFLWLDKSGSAAEALQTAKQDAAEKLSEAVDAVPCPICGRFQTSMIPEARRWYLYDWHRIGGWLAFLGALFMPFPYLMHKCFPENIGGNILFWLDQAVFFGGLILMGLRFWLSRRFKPNDLPLDQRLALGREQASVLIKKPPATTVS